MNIIQLCTDLLLTGDEGTNDALSNLILDHSDDIKVVAGFTIVQCSVVQLRHCHCGMIKHNKVRNFLGGG